MDTSHENRERESRGRLPRVVIERVDEHGVIVNGERLASRTVLWTAGVVASPAGRWLGAEVDRAGRIKVNPDLSAPGPDEGK